MYADPTTITLAIAGAIPLTRINQDGYSSEWRYQNATNRYTLKIRHTKVSAKGTEPAKDRHNAELTKVTFAAGAVPEYSEKVYFVTENITSSVSVDLPNGLAAWLIATSNAALVKLTNMEL